MCSSFAAALIYLSLGVEGGEGGVFVLALTWFSERLDKCETLFFSPAVVIQQCHWLLHVHVTVSAGGVEEGVDEWGVEWGVGGGH